MSDEHNHAHEHHSVNYTAIFGLLCVCTVLSIGFDLLKEEMSYPVLLTLILGVAVCKATFVLLYFMHIKFERAWKYVLLAPTAVLACALPFALMPDISFHYYLVAAPQLETEINHEDGHGGAHGGTHGAAGHAAEGHDAKTHGADEHGAKEHGAEATHKDAGHDHDANKAAAKRTDDPQHPVKNVEKKVEEKAHN